MPPDEFDPDQPTPSSPLDGGTPPRPPADTGQIAPRRTPHPTQSPPFPSMRPSKRLSADLERAAAEQGMHDGAPAEPPHAPQYPPAQPSEPAAPQPPDHGSAYTSPQSYAPAQAPYPSQPPVADPYQPPPVPPYPDLSPTSPTEESPVKWIVIAVIAGLVAIGAMIGIALQH